MYIEDILHLVVNSVPEILPADTLILRSISQQVKKGSALTDRQYQLVKLKMETYREQISNMITVDLDQCLAKSRLPLREINRSKTISFIMHCELVGPGVPYESRKDSWKWIKIQFPFNKKQINEVERIAGAHRDKYFHRRGTCTHYFRYSENILFKIVDVFKNKHFQIDDDILEFYNKVSVIKENAPLYLTNFSNGEFYNLTPPTLELIETELGSVDKIDTVKLFDRRRRYGIRSVDCQLPDSLTGVIAARSGTEICVNPGEYNLDAIVESIQELDRFPILLLIDTPDQLSQVETIHKAFFEVVPNEKQSVLFREPNTIKYNLNNYIHDNNLNNWVDADTKIVYISKSKLPKLLLKTDWRPMTVLSLSSNRSVRTVDTYVRDVCDCVIYHDSEPSLIKKRRNA